MNLLKEGLIKIHDELSKLEPKWDGYDAVPINPLALRSVLNGVFVADIITLFRLVGISEPDIEIIPRADGLIQYEAENSDIYLEITISEKYIENWKLKRPGYWSDDIK